MNIPVVITAQEKFPTPEILKLVIAPNPESVVYTVDRDGASHIAHLTILHSEGDEYHLFYAQNKLIADEYLAASKKKHDTRVVVAKTLAEMNADESNEAQTKTKELQATLNAFSKEFATDNLVAFVLGKDPFSSEEQKRVETYIKEGEFAHAETALGNLVHDRKDAQKLIDSMRNVSAMITELESLGFDWENYALRKMNRRAAFEDEFGSYHPTERKDHNGFSSGDIKIRSYEVYRPAMGRKVGHRLESWRVMTALTELQPRLERERDLLLMRKENLRKEKQQAKEGGFVPETGPEVIHRGVHDEVGDERFGDDGFDED
jgi:hypothetical protein